MSELVEKLFAIHDSLTEASLPHAFGGAIALAYCVEEPRGTRDLDVNIFVDASEAERRSASLPREVRVSKEDIAKVERDGQARLDWDGTPVDVFLNNVPLHEAVSRRRSSGSHSRAAKCRSSTAPRWSIFKAFFDRTKDWADMEAIASGDPRGHRRRRGDDRRSGRPRRSSGQAAGEPDPARRRLGRGLRSSGRFQRDRVVGDDDAVGVPLALDLGEAGADVGGQDRVGVAGALGEVEVGALAGPGLHRLLDLRSGAAGIASPSSGVIGMPTLYMTKPASRWVRAPPSGSGRPSAPPRWRSSLSSSGEPEPGPATLAKASIASSGSSRIVRPSPSPGTGFSGSMWMRQRPSAGIRVQVSMIVSPSSRSGATISSPSSWLPMQAPSIVSSGRPRIGSGTSGIGGGVTKRTTEVTSSGTLGGPVAVGAHRLGAELGREDEGAGVDLGDRDQAQLQRGDDRVAATTAAQRPEQVGLVLGVDRAGLAVGGDQLDRLHAVAGEAVAAAEPAEAAAEGVAGDADVGRGARHRAEAVLPAALAQLGDEDAGLDPGRLRLGVDLDPAHALGLEQDRALERRQRRRRRARSPGRPP